MENNCTNKDIYNFNESTDLYYNLYISCIKYKKETNKSINCEKYYTDIQTYIDKQKS